MWSAATGWVDLGALGYPLDIPAAISPGGRVVTTGSSYQLGDPASVTALPALPRGFVGAGSNGSAINDAGDQAHFLVSTSTQNLAYPFRLSNGGTWQQLSSFGTGHLSRSAMGSINDAQDVTLTVGSTGVVAAGPAGVTQSLGALISPAYGVTSVTDGGPMNASGEILAQAMIGRSPRLVKMTPATACTGDCIVVHSLTITAQFVEDPALPGACIEGGKMFNVATVTALVIDEHGAPLANAQLSGRFLDDYWTNNQVTGTTNANGVVSWTQQGPCGVGAIAFFVDGAAAGPRTLDRTRGALANSVIPSTTPPPPPVVDVAIAGHSVVVAAAGKSRTRGVSTVQVVLAGTLVGVGGVTVSGRWTGDYTGTGSAVTDSTGTVTIQTPGVRGGGQFTFCVTSLTGSGINAQTGLSNCATSGTSPPPSPPSNLTVVWRTKVQVRADLSWTGGAPTVDIYEDGAVSATVPNVNTFRDTTPGRSYQVCDAGLATAVRCTQVVFAP